MVTRWIPAGTSGVGIAETSAQANVVTQETTTSTSYVDLATAGPSVTLSPGSTQNHLIWIKCEMSTSAAGPCDVNVSIAGGAAVDGEGAKAVSAASLIPAAQVYYAAAVVNGSTHTMKYKNDAGNTSTYRNRRIVATTT